MCIMGLFYGKAMWSFIMRPEFTGNYCLGEFSWTAIFLSFLASWLFEISMDHRKKISSKAGVRRLPGSGIFQWDNAIEKKAS